MGSATDEELYLWFLKVRRDILAHEKYLGSKWTNWVGDLPVTLGKDDDLDTVRRAIAHLESLDEMGDPGNPPMPPY
jgi:hypothetical protein